MAQEQTEKITKEKVLKNKVIVKSPPSKKKNITEITPAKKPTQCITKPNLSSIFNIVRFAFLKRIACTHPKLNPILLRYVNYLQRVWLLLKSHHPSFVSNLLLDSIKVPFTSLSH